MHCPHYVIRRRKIAICRYIICENKIIRTFTDMKPSFPKIIKQIGIHLIIWVVVWFLFFYFFSYNASSNSYAIWFSSFLVPLTAVVTYFVVYFLLPQYLLTKKYRELALYSFYTLIFTAYSIVMIIYGCLFFLLNFNISIMPPMGKNFVFVLILVLLVTGVFSFLYIIRHNFATAQSNKELQNKILDTQLQLKNQELQYLKMQIHPHFLFNTLNTIYGLSLKSSQQTPDVILKLSNLLDYILYQVNKPYVSLAEEVDHIIDYMDLERIRFKDTLKITSNLIEMDDTLMIAPMILIPFVENAFKHGRIIDGYLHIDIKLAVADDRLEFFISNTAGEAIEEKSGGIGLQNIRKRLEMHYPTSHHLEITQHNDRYSVSLSLSGLKNLTS